MSILQAMLANITFTDTAVQVDAPESKMVREILVKDSENLFMVSWAHYKNNPDAVAGHDAVLSRKMNGDVVYQADPSGDPKSLVPMRPDWEDFQNDLSMYLCGVDRKTAIDRREQYRGRYPLWSLIDMPDRVDFLLSPGAVRMLALDFRQIRNDKETWSALHKYSAFDAKYKDFFNDFLKIMDATLITAQRGGIIVFQ